MVRASVSRSPLAASTRITPATIETGNAPSWIQPRSLGLTFSCSSVAACLTASTRSPVASLTAPTRSPVASLAVSILWAVASRAISTRSRPAPAAFFMPSVITTNYDRSQNTFDRRPRSRKMRERPTVGRDSVLRPLRTRVITSDDPPPNLVEAADRSPDQSRYVRPFRNHVSFST